MRSSVLLAFVLLACGNSAETKTPSTSGSSSSSSGETAPTTTASAEPAASAEPEKPRGKPFELYNSCTKVVTVIIGKDPNAADAGKRTAAPSSSIELPRDSAGNQIVTLADDKGEPTPVHVTVTRGIKRVEVGRSCSTLNAN
jgi:hypothetical protein